MQNPSLSQRKLYADFTESFDNGFETLIQPLQKLVSEHMGRHVDRDQITDYAVNWGLHPETLNYYTNIDVVTIQMQYERTILLQISISGNEPATERHVLNVKKGQTSLIKNTLIMEILEMPELKNLVFKLSPESAFFTKLGYNDCKSDIKFDIRIRCLMMGSDLGYDILVHFVNYYDILKYQIKQ